MTLRRGLSVLIPFLLAASGCAATVVVAPGGGERFPHLHHAREEIQRARGHVHAAEEAHAAHGTLGGHGGQAMAALDAALAETDQAAAFASSAAVAGPPGVVTAKPPLTAVPDDVRYPNLGDARLETEKAIRQLEDAEQYHAPIGTLGGHGAAAVQHCRRALQEIGEAERWADAHR
jgi:hypothetical protein